MSARLISDRKIIEQDAVSRFRHDGETEKSVILLDRQDLDKSCLLTGGDHGKRLFLTCREGGLIECMDLLQALS